MKQQDLSTLSQTHAKVFLAVKGNPTFSISKLAKYCGLGTSRIGQIMADSKKENRIERVGSKKNGYWKIKDE